MAERRINQMAIKSILALAYILTISSTASAAVINQPQPHILPQSQSQTPPQLQIPPQPQNLSSSSSSSSTTTTSSNENYCTSNERWLGPGTTYIPDCIAAVQYFYEVEVATRRTPRTTDLEFLTPRLKPSSQEMPPLVTPRKYTVGTCTLAIVMLNFFHKKPDLPPGLKDYHSPRDVATVWEIWEAAQKLEKVCLRTNQPGWATEGIRDAIGVFVWGSSSVQDFNVPVPYEVKIPKRPSTVGMGTTPPLSINGTLATLQGFGGGGVASS